MNRLVLTRKIMMKTRLGVGLLATVAAAGTLGFAEPVFSQTMARTPLQSAIQETGQSGGPRETQCGYIANRPNYVLEVTEPFASLEIQVESQGAFTLVIVGDNGFRECLLADDVRGDVITAPGLLDRGTYAVFVGDRNGQRNGYSMVIEQN